VDADESPYDAAVRELKEELGILVAPGRLLVVDWVPPRPGRTEGVMFVFYGGVLDPARGSEIHLPVEELRNSIDSNTGRSHRLRSDMGHTPSATSRVRVLSAPSQPGPDRYFMVLYHQRIGVRACGGFSFGGVGAPEPQGGDGQMQVSRTQHVSGCRECGAGSVLGTPVATTGRATKKGEPP
jgi:hypothetical protein